MRGGGVRCGKYGVWEGEAKDVPTPPNWVCLMVSQQPSDFHRWLHAWQIIGSWRYVGVTRGGVACCEQDRKEVLKRVERERRSARERKSEPMYKVVIMSSIFRIPMRHFKTKQFNMLLTIIELSYQLSYTSLED